MVTPGAVHGAKHAEFKATFVRPTVVLEHSSYIANIKCKDREINVCFKSPEARQAAQDS